MPDLPMSEEDKWRMFELEVSKLFFTPSIYLDRTGFSMSPEYYDQKVDFNDIRSFPDRLEEFTLYNLTLTQIP
jgi:hypothetical protein